MSPELIFKFQQCFKQLQIHAGLGITEENIAKVSDIAFDLAELAEKLYSEVNPENMDFQGENKQVLARITVKK